ncbi:MAG: type II toxin-antitoxin system Phd/YefM family antitoxin [Propionibacteriaceae bacterium]|jgi:antitoxin (DNA-binding transcriptional repressor) of toxin-antitoxin stability system|nr:type II toxin-antitoxin system Phd/YefM family antitoxin [Propionibacteriaceae bacterium]
MTAQPLTVSIYDTKTHLSQMLSKTESELMEYIITRHGKPVAKFIPFPTDRTRRQPGAWEGLMEIPDGWDDFTEEDEAVWYG